MHMIYLTPCSSKLASLSESVGCQTTKKLLATPLSFCEGAADKLSAVPSPDDCSLCNDTAGLVVPAQREARVFCLKARFQFLDWAVYSCPPDAKQSPVQFQSNVLTWATVTV